MYGNITGYLCNCVPIHETQDWCMRYISSLMQQALYYMHKVGIKANYPYMLSDLTGI